MPRQYFFDMEDAFIRDKLMSYLKTLPTWDDSHFTHEKSLSGEVRDYNLMSTGIVDSVNIIQLVIFIEAEFQIQLESRDLINDNFKTLENMVQFVSKRKTALIG